MTPMRRAWALIALCLAIGGGVSISTARAADGYDVRDDGRDYRDTDRGDNYEARPDNSDNDAPVRLARFSMVSGNVTWRRDDGEWSQATMNLPLREGAQVWVTEGGRAEIQFDDGSLLRLGTGSIVTLQTMYSDSEGEFTEIKMNDGLASLRLKQERSVFQVDTPFASVKSSGPAKLRVGVDDNVEVAVRKGDVSVENERDHATLRAGDYLRVRGENDGFDVRELPAADRWERWNDDRDQWLAEVESRPTHQYLPENLRLVCHNLDSYGSWHDDSEYGHVWCPRVSDADWRPYHRGHWVWVNPFGWTWVADEPWGWAPYHYGTWIRRPYGWGWVPGPTCQYWSPAVVHFTECDGNVAWVPLAPREVYYPTTFSIGVWGRNWGFSFSIGGCASYYYSDYDRGCRPRVWRTRYVNSRVTNIYNTTIINNNTTIINNRRTVNWVPVNAGSGGGSTTTVGGFGGHGNYQPLPRTDTTIFTKGTVNTPGRGRVISGPIDVKPTNVSYTPTRTINPGKQLPVAVERPVYRAPLPPAVQTVQGAQDNRPKGGFIYGPGRGASAPVANSGTGRGTPTVVNPQPVQKGNRPTETSRPTDTTQTQPVNRFPAQPQRDNPGSVIVPPVNTTPDANTAPTGKVRRAPVERRDPVERREPVERNDSAEQARRARESLSLPTKGRSAEPIQRSPQSDTPTNVPARTYEPPRRDDTTINRAPDRGWGKAQPQSAPDRGNRDNTPAYGRPTYSGSDTPRRDDTPSRPTGDYGRHKYDSMPSGGPVTRDYGRGSSSSSSVVTPSAPSAPPASTPPRSEPSKSAPSSESNSSSSSSNSNSSDSAPKKGRR